MSYPEEYGRYYEAVERALSDVIPLESCPQESVEDAMRYSLLGGGKRLRGVLTLAFAELFGGSLPDALPLACGVELVHAYSLIHDDLPCMDNDTLRRGKPTCHVRHGEAVALLAGDGLLTRAFGLIAGEDCRLPPAGRLAAVSLLAHAAGTKGMIGGQVIDIEHEGKPVDGKLLDTLHSLKTGALIRAAAGLGCCAAGASREQTGLADRYASRLGLIFQITDDLLDVTSTAEALGKSAGSDRRCGKTTYASLYGLEQSRKILAVLAEEAKAAVAPALPQSAFLRDLVDEMVVRTK